MRRSASQSPRATPWRSTGDGGEFGTGRLVDAVRAKPAGQPSLIAADHREHRSLHAGLGTGAARACARDWATAPVRLRQGASAAGRRACATMSTTGCGVARCGRNAARKRRTHAVARNGRAEAARRRDGQAGRLSASGRHKQHEIGGGGHARSAASHARDVGGAAKPMAVAHGTLAATEPLSMPVVSSLDREPLATLTPPAAKNRAPGPAGHAGTKAVLTLAFANLGLVRAFHRRERARRQDMPRARSVAPRDPWTDFGGSVAERG